MSEKNSVDEGLEGPAPPVSLTPSLAEVLLGTWLSRPVDCGSIRPLSGGCVYTVLEVSFEGEESPVVMKLSGRLRDKGLERECRVLEYLKSRELFPVPQTFLCDTSGDRLPFSYLLMERLPGKNLSEGATHLTPFQRNNLERQMGEAVARLHSHTGPSYGLLGQAVKTDSWPDWFGARLEEEWNANVRLGLLSYEALQTVEKVLGRLPELLDVPDDPSLIHGDLWSANIMVNTTQEFPLTGFLDPAGVFAHREYELAYLDVWKTVGPAFYKEYHRTHPPLEGYSQRRMIYWLHTLLLHVRFFGSESFIRRTEEVCRELRPLMG